VANGIGLARNDANYIWATGGSNSYLLFGVSNVGSTSWGNASLRITTVGNVEISKSLTVSEDITASGFKTTAGTNDYVLLAGGGSKPLSDFATSTSTNYSRSLLGRKTDGTDYDAVDGNLVFAEWNT
jgi:hypothetical protein